LSFLQKRKSGDEVGKAGFGSPGRRKALNGEAQERWWLKKASKVEKVRRTTAERVAKP